VAAWAKDAERRVGPWPCPRFPSPRTASPSTKPGRREGSQLLGLRTGCLRARGLRGCGCGSAPAAPAVRGRLRQTADPPAASGAQAFASAIPLPRPGDSKVSPCLCSRVKGLMCFCLLDPVAPRAACRQGAGCCPRPPLHRAHSLRAGLGAGHDLCLLCTAANSAQVAVQGS